MDRINIRRICLFLGFTFLLSWGFDWLIIFYKGISVYRNLGMNPWGMLVPAFVALSLQIFVFKDSPVYFRSYKEKPRWVLYAFLILTIVYGVLIFIAVSNEGSKEIFQGVGALLFTLWTLFIFFISSQSDSKAFEQAGLKLGDIETGQRFVLGIVLFIYCAGSP